MAQLTVTATEDYRDGVPAIPANTNSIVFTNAAIFARATFGSNQFGAGLISNSIAITGNGQRNNISVELSSASTFSAAGWTFSNANWTANNNFGAPADMIELTGTSGSDTITGSSQQNSFNGGDGADTLTGGAQSDEFQVDAGDVDAGESINGGDGTDRIAMTSTGTIDFTVPTITITGVEIFFRPSTLPRPSTTPSSGPAPSPRWTATPPTPRRSSSTATMSTFPTSRLLIGAAPTRPSPSTGPAAISIR